MNPDTSWLDFEGEHELIEIEDYELVIDFNSCLGRGVGRGRHAIATTSARNYSDIQYLRFERRR